MNTTDLYFSDAYLKHQVHLLRFTSSEQAKVDALFRAMVPELKNKLNNGLTDFSKRRVNAVLKQTEEVIDRYYGMMGGKSSWTKLYRGETNAIRDERTIKGVMSTSTNPDIAKIFSGEKGISKEYFLDPKAKIIKMEDITKELLKIKPASEISAADWVTYAKENGYDAIDMRSLKMGITSRANPTLKGFEDEIKILNPNMIKTEAQLSKLTPQAIDYAGLAHTEADFTAKTFTSIGLDASLPSEATLKALVNGSLIEGAPSAKWWAKQSDDLAFKFSNQVRQGVAQNETVQQIVRRVAGSKKLGIPGVMDTSRRNAFSLIHTSVQQVSNDARMATFKENSDVVKGMRQLSTMDSHTSDICLAYSGAEWDIDGTPINGNTLPFNGGTPRHWGCRSVITPITLTFRELGIDAPEPKGTRASDEGQISSSTTMAGFLKNKPKSYVDDLLGPGRSKMFLDGKLTLPELLNFSGRPLSLEALKGK